jgi:phosphate transport system substrate-binding protein
MIFKIISVSVLALSLVSAGESSAETLRIGGTGAVTAVLPHLFAEFGGKEGVTLEVIPSLGHSGGMRAAADGVLDIAMGGRSLNSQEKALGLTSVLAIETPYALVTSHVKPNSLSKADIAGIYTADSAKWSDGTPMRIILRPKSDSDTVVLGAVFPGMAGALESARQRAGIPTAATDQDNAQLAEQVPGSIAGATLTQVKMEQRRLRYVPIDQIEPSLEALENGTYPYGKRIYFVLPEKRSPAAERFVAYLQTPEGRAALRATGNRVVENQASQ